MNVKFKFNFNCKYDLGDVDQQDWNKLVGFSRGYHRKNSVRIVWRWNVEKQKMEIAHYWYKDGVRSWGDIKEIELGKVYKEKLEIEKGKYPKWGYMLWPYFGGNKKAPHDMSLKLEWKF
jgi:hypothetical protein